MNEWLKKTLESSLFDVLNKLKQLNNSANYIEGMLESGKEINESAIVQYIIEHSLFQQEITVYMVTLNSLLLITGGRDVVVKKVEEELYENLLYKLNDVKRSSNGNTYSINRACELLIKSYNNYKLHGVDNEKKD